MTMGTIGWRFPPLAGGLQQGAADNNIEGFKGEKVIDNLARELCQNSLDAKNKKDDKPVRIVFTLQYVPTKKFAAIWDYQTCLKGCRAYWKDHADARLQQLLSDAEAMMAQPTIPILVVSDYHTTGLFGSHGGSPASPWAALVQSSGVSAKNDPNSSGSYGIGKNAPFACSDLRVVFYNTVADDGAAFIGVARLASTQNEAGKGTQSTGMYQYNDDEREDWHPIYHRDDSFSQYMDRQEQGTDVIIAGFNETDQWMDNVEWAVLKNFFVAIHENKLDVTLYDGHEKRIIRKDTLPELMARYGEEKATTDQKKTYELYTAFTCHDEKEVLSILGKESHDVDIYIKLDSSYHRTIGRFRATGMLVGMKRKNLMQGFAVSVVVRSREVGAILKETEPPMHNEWDYKLISKQDKEKRKKAKEVIEAIDKGVNDILNSLIDKHVSDSMDAVGMSEYLPDDNDGTDDVGSGTDLLRQRVEVKDIRRKNDNAPDNERSGKPGTGKKGRGHGRHNGTISRGGGKNPNVEGTGDDRGTKHGDGSNRLVIPTLRGQRIFSLDAAGTTYRMVMMPIYSYEEVYITCAAHGEDGNEEALNFESCTHGNRPIPLSKDKKKAGPFTMRANEVIQLTAQFAQKGRFRIGLGVEGKRSK